MSLIWIWLGLGCHPLAGSEWELEGDLVAVVDRDDFPPDNIATACLRFREDGETQAWVRTYDGADLVRLPGAWEVVASSPLEVVVGEQLWVLQHRVGRVDVVVDDDLELSMWRGCPLAWDVDLLNGFANGPAQCTE